MEVGTYRSLGYGRTETRVQIYSILVIPHDFTCVEFSKKILVFFSKINVAYVTPSNSAIFQLKTGKTIPAVTEITQNKRTVRLLTILETVSVILSGVCTFTFKVKNSYFKTDFSILHIR